MANKRTPGLGRAQVEMPNTSQQRWAACSSSVTRSVMRWRGHSTESASTKCDAFWHKGTMRHETTSRAKTISSAGRIAFSHPENCTLPFALHNLA
eukprot:1857132-Amphidinium_carterae.1